MDNEQYFYDGLAEIDAELGPQQVKLAQLNLEDLETELSKPFTLEKLSVADVTPEESIANPPEVKEKTAACATPGAKINSGGAGRGLARGGGKGPMGIPANIANSPKTSPSEMKKILVNKQKMQKQAKDMPHFTDQDRPEKVKDIYKALKREHPTMPAEMKARIAARQGKPGKQHQGPPYKAPITKTSAFSDIKKKLLKGVGFQELPPEIQKKSPAEQAMWFKQNKMKTGAEQIVRDRLREGTSTGITQVDNASDKNAPVPEAPETKTAALVTKTSRPWRSGYVDRTAVRNHDAYSRFMNAAMDNKKDEDFGMTEQERDNLTQQYNKLTGSNVPMTANYQGLKSFIADAEEKEKEREKMWEGEKPNKERRYFHFPTIKMSEEEFSKERGMLLKLSASKGELANALQFDSAVATSLEEEEKGKKDLFKNNAPSSDTMRAANENPSDAKVTPMPARDVQTPMAGFQGK